MWCQNCGQDVPSLPTAERGHLACGRCGTSTPAPRRATKELAAASLHGIDLGASGERSAPHTNWAPAAEPFPADEPWELRQEVRRLRAHFPGKLAAPVVPTPTPLGDELAGLGGAAMLQMNWPAAAQPLNAAPRPRVSAVGWISRISATTGLVALGVGGGLLAAASMFGQAGFWRAGLLTLAAGHVALLVGLLLWLGQIGTRSREAVERLTHLDHRMRDLHHSTQLLGTTRSSASQAFYSHMAEGASPNLLLADLKGQLDLLAVRLSQR